MTFRLNHHPAGRVSRTCRVCGLDSGPMSDRGTEMWARDHDQRECARRARVQKAAQTPVAGSLAASHVENDHAPTQTTAALTGAVTTIEEVAS